MYGFRADIVINGKVNIKANSKQEARELIALMNKDALINEIYRNEEDYPNLEVKVVSFLSDSLAMCPKCDGTILYMDAVRQEISRVLVNGVVSLEEVEEKEISDYNHAKVRCNNARCDFKADYRYYKENMIE
ncbi:MAG: hypothetical protein E6778_17785 [Niallia nealsonii]|nr:hypothetical protein [Niallia nealsonii]